MVAKALLGAAAVCILIAITPYAAYGVDQEKKPDPRVGRVTYEGSGEKEHAPQYAEVWIDYSVRCRKSAKDVSEAISAVSSREWTAIVKKISGAFTEVERSYWGNIQSIEESEGSRIVTILPGGTEAPAGSAKRVDVCSGKELPLQAQVPTIFSGSQRIGVRSADMDWIEGLVRSVNAMAHSTASDAVRVSAGAIKYNITEETRRQMLNDVLEQARRQATGGGSKFESDRRTLRYEKAHFLGHRLSDPLRYQPTVGQSVTRGQAPKVQLSMPFLYSIYAEAGDVLEPNRNNGNHRVGLVSQYEVQGQSVSNADYVMSTVTVNVSCQESLQAASKAVNDASRPIVERLERFQGNKPATEKDRIMIPETQSPSPYFPYRAVDWDSHRAGYPATKYLNLCTYKVVAAPPSGNVSDLQPFWQAGRSLSVRSSDFAGVTDLVESLQKDYGSATTATDSVHFSVSNLVGYATAETKQQLALQARCSATAVILDPNGPLAGDMRAHGFQNAYLRSIREGEAPEDRREKVLAYGGAAGVSMAAPAAPAPSPEPEIEVITKPNEQRPTLRVVRHYAFDYQFMTKNYVPLLRSAGAMSGASGNQPTR